MSTELSFSFLFANIFLIFQKTKSRSEVRKTLKIKKKNKKRTEMKYFRSCNRTPYRNNKPYLWRCKSIYCAKNYWLKCQPNINSKIEVMSKKMLSVRIF